MATGIRVDVKYGTVTATQLPDAPVDLETARQSAVARMKADFRRKFEEPASVLADWRGIRHREQTEGGFPTSMSVEEYAVYIAARQQAREASNAAEEIIMTAASIEELKVLRW
jgi:hypothetical protein